MSLNDPWTAPRSDAGAAVLPALAGMSHSSNAAGHDESIPPTFLVLFDLLAIGVAFAITRPLSPLVQWLLLPSGPFRMTLPVWLSLPGNFGPSDFSSLPSLIWILLVTGPTTVLFLALFGGYRPIIDQSRARVVAGSVLSLLVALSIVTLLLFTVKDLNSSRVFTFTFGGLAIAGLAGYRLAIRVYQNRQLASGRYARNVIVIGQASAVAWMNPIIAG
jgi:hypothetical protein